MTEVPPKEDDLLSLWKTLPVESVKLSLEEVRSQASKLQRTVRRRNLREVVAAGFVVLAFGFYAFRFDGIIFKTGCGLIIAAAIYIVWYMTALAGAHAVPTSEMETCLAFHRRELERQRDLLRGVWRWYLAPMIPGFVVFEIGGSVEHHDPAIATLLVSSAFLVAITGVWLLNRHAARKLQRQIDALPS